MKHTNRQICPEEAAILLAFAEGEPPAAPDPLAHHLANCPDCRQALMAVKSLDAILASQTPSDLTDQQADAFLAFLVTPAPAPPPTKPHYNRVVMVLCLLLLLILPRMECPPGNQANPDNGFAGPTLQLAGDLIIDTQEPETTTSVNCKQNILTRGRRLLTTQGRARQELVVLLRKREKAFRRLLNTGRSGNWRGNRLPEILGALGATWSVSSLSSLPLNQRFAIAAKARQTGDTTSFTFLLALYLEGANRVMDFGTHGAIWFCHLTPEEAQLLVPLLVKEINTTRHHRHRELCRQLLATTVCDPKATGILYP